MIHRTLASGFASLPIAIAAGILLAYQVHLSERPKRTTALSSKPPAQDVAAAIPSLADGTPNGHALDAIVSLLANSLKATQPSAGSMTAAADRVLPATPVPDRPKSMTMLSISCYKEGEMLAARTLSIRCRTCSSLSNTAGSDHIVVQGVVTEDIVSGAGKILISAGSKVSGIGHVESDSGRLKSRGSWSIFAGNHELRVQAELKDADAGFPGILGKETSSESELSQRQAVVRDGRYYFLTDKTPFVLSLEGEVALKELKTLDSSE